MSPMPFLRGGLLLAALLCVHLQASARLVACT